VHEGLQMAKESGLPQSISDVIPQHHGTRVMTYFYQKARDSGGAKEPEPVEADFRYPGPTPQSREAAIIMMADSVEAASRTLLEPTKSQIKRMIDRLVDSIILDGQLVECEITLKDIQLVKESFFKILTGTFHHRIDYPGYDFKEKADGSEGIALKNPGSE
jgi:membrane-associated HD superfamily phosphohydrolase